MAQETLSRDVEVLRASLPPLPEPLARPVLVVVVGLPGTGKSYFSRRLAERFPMAVLETDALRKALFPRPTYSPEESARLFRAVHGLIESLLRRGVPVLLDATNLVEANREHLYHIAEKTGARLILARTEAPPEVVRERLARRQQTPVREDHSDAGWEVYERMRRSVDPLRRQHYVVDTTRDIGPVLERILRDIRRWIRIS